MNIASSKISVVIPTYNRRELVRLAIDSVLAQTWGNLEVIVVDDGSTDTTGAAIRDLYGTDPRVRYVWQKNAERAVARNTGIKIARGDWIAFLDSDDLYLPGKLEQQARLFVARPELVMVHTGWGQLYPDGTTVPMMLGDDERRAADILGGLATINFIGSATPLVRRNLVDRIGGFNKDRRICFEDWELWTRIAALGPVGYVPEVLALHRLHKGNTDIPLTPPVYCSLIRAVIAEVEPAQQAVVRQSARQRLWLEIRAAVDRGDASLARAYWREGLALLGADLMRDLVQDRWTLANILLGARGAGALRSLQQRLKTVRH